MRFHSTNKKSKNFSLSDALCLGLAPDRGLFMPDSWPSLPPAFFKNIDKLNFNQLALSVAKKYSADIPEKQLQNIINDVFTFPVPLKKLNHNLYLLELFHGPTMAFKDFGARFLSRSLSYFLKAHKNPLNIIVATSGDTGSAVASGFFKVPNIKVFILFPSGKVSPLQEKQLTTYGHNITAIEVKGSFDDCQKLAKQVLGDADLNRQIRFSSANSINFGRLLPQSFYYFWAYAQLKKQGDNRSPILAVPSGNFGNLFAGLMAKKMGLPIHKFIAATNSNNIVPKYLQSGKFEPKKSKKTISNAMDVGNPSNFARILEIYHKSHRQMTKDIIGISISDTDTKHIIRQIYKKNGYILDPHTAVGVKAALQYQLTDKDRYPIIVLSTAHPAKFKEIVEPVINKKIPLPKQLQGAMKKKKQAIKIAVNYEQLKQALLLL